MQIPVYLRFAVPFLSTPSARRATRRHPIVSNTNQNFYPRPPRGGRQECKKLGTSSKHFYPRPPRGGRRHQMHNGTKTKKISIHALREEGDPFRASAADATTTFLSTPSARRATCRSHCLRPVVLEISIHALREEGDSYHMRGQAADIIVFLSTPSARRATRSNDRGRSGHHHFYPRPPRGGRPSAPTAVCKARRNFYPRPPRGGRHLRMAIALQHIFISIHALREEGDCITVKSMHRAKQFLSTPSARRATHQHQG